MTAVEEIRLAALHLADQAARGLEEEYDPQIPAAAVAAFADWLSAYAEHLAATTHPSWQDTVAVTPLAVARAILGQSDGSPR